MKITNLPFLNFFIVAIIFIALWLPSLSFSQGAISFKNISKGISQNTITGFTQDEYGFLWVSTYYGLNRFDGAKFDNFDYKEGDFSTLKGGYIRGLEADQKGKVWFGVLGEGLHSYDIDKNEFRHYTSDNHPITNIFALYIARDGRIWLGTEGSGLYFFDPTTENFHFYNNEKNAGASVLSNSIYDLSEDESGNFWLGTNNEGVVKIDKNSGKVTTFKNKDAQTLSDIVTRVVEIGKSQNIWIGTNKGFFKIGDSEHLISLDLKGKNREVLQNSVILSIYENGNDLWVGTENNGLFKISISTGESEVFVNNAFDKKTISGNSIWSIFKDKEGTFWFGTFMTGINRLEEKSSGIRYFDQIIIDQTIWNFRSVTSFAETEEYLWIGSDGDGLVRITPDFQDFTHFSATKSEHKISHNNVVSLFNDSKGNLWVGTWGGGINFLKKGEKEFREIRPQAGNENSLAGENILSITEDSQGRIWIAAHVDGLDLYIPEEDKFIHFNEHTPGRKIFSDLIFTLHADEFDNVWIGTLGNGFGRIKIDENYEIIDSQRFFTEGQEETVFTVNSIFIDAENNTWVGTTGEGLIRISETGAFQKFTRKDGLPSNLINAVEADNAGNIWGATNRGIFTLNPQSGEVKSYSESDDDISNDYYKSSVYKRKNNEILFGGLSGFISVAADEISSNQSTPQVYITDVNVLNKPFEPKDPASSRSIFNGQMIVLDYFQSDISFDFTAINFLENGKNKFSFKLENYDKEWRKAGSERNAYYSDLPPGNYKFRVKAYTSDGQWQDSEAALDLKINEAWYLTAKMKCFYTFCILGIILGLRNMILHRLNLKNQLELEQLELDKLKELDKMKEVFFTNISHEFRTPLTLIMSPLKTLLGKKQSKEDRGIFEVMLKNSSYLHRLTNQIMEISRLEAGADQLRVSAGNITYFLDNVFQNFTAIAQEKSIDYQIEMPQKSLTLFFEKEKMEKVLVNLLSNAVKFTGSGGKIKVEMIEQPTKVLIRICDTGEEIPKEERANIFERFYKSKNKNNSISSGVGLSLSKQLVEMHGGKISLESEKDPIYENVFIVELPKGTAHLTADQIIATTDFAHKNELFFQHNLSPKLKNGTYGNVIEPDKPIVLVVEDNDDMRSYISSLFMDDYVVLEAENGREGYDKAVKFVPEIIISDVMMPEMTGYKLSERLKDNPVTDHISIVLLTAKSARENIRKGYAAGAESFITKPFDPELLKLHIQNLLKARERFKLRVLENATQQSKPNKSALAKPEEEFINEVIAKIEKEISNSNFKVEDLTKALGFSKSQFYRKLKGLTDKSPNEFIRIIRLKRAAQLLIDSDLRISEITYNVGFNDLEYFRTCFKKQYEMSPNEFRKTHTEAP